ncbi:Tc toxin subunit A [Pseudomonas fluorescens]|uniref:Tc toxin subunit A n=1 Tax=Pseudomonas fluorescens TaxID=294 RepID=UPI00069C4786|nr:Tc toxin subunit A [Pseudomonas fluorescens]
MDGYPLLQALITANSPEKHRELQKLFKDTLKLTSVFDITRLTEASFKKKVEDAINRDSTLQGHASSIDIGTLYDNAKCLAAQVSHLYREQQLSSGQTQHHWHPPGIRAVEKQGPTYTNLFQENWDESCKVDSIAAIDSPVAYLRALYLFAKQLETSASQSANETVNRILLEKRRPDLAVLSIDQQNTFTAQPMLKIVNDILNTNIQEALKSTADKNKSTYGVLAQRRYPFALPYNIFHHQCLLGLSGKTPSLGELNYLISPHLPITQTVNIQYGQVRTSTPIEAQQLLSGLSPQQQALLTEVPGEDTQYWQSLYGTHATATSLSNINSFMERTELNAGQIEALLSQGKHAPRHSSNHPKTVSLPGPYGARYINGPFAVGTTTADNMTIIKNEGVKKIAEATDQRLVRLQRMIRLQRWLDIPFAELDTLILGAFESQVPRNTLMQLDTYTVRTLGVYRYFNRRYSINAEEFAALLYRVSPSATGDAPALFDRVFNPARLFDTPLVLDNRSFSTDDSDPASHTILQHLSASLGLPLTDDSLLLIVRNTLQYLGQLKCDLHTLSSIYRQARIARMLGISIADSAMLANLLGGESISKCLANGYALDSRTFQINIKNSSEHFNLVARFRAPKQVDPNNPPRLLSGSTLTTNTSLFADSKIIGKIHIRFPGDSSSNDDPDDDPSISINQIPNVAPNTVISLEDCPLVLPNDDLDVLLRRATKLATVIQSPRSQSSNDLDNTSNYTDVTLTQNEPQGLDVLNLLDVLMQMDWITNWLRESAYDIPKLRRLLEPMGSDDHSFRDLQQYLTKLSGDTLQCVVTQREIAELSLPKEVEWRARLAGTLLDDKGLVKNFAPAIEDDVPQKLATALNDVIEPLMLGDVLKDDCKKKLKDLLLLAHDRQQHLIEKFLQETSQLPMNCAKAVLLWANSSVHQILVEALGEAPSTRLPPVLHPVMRHAEAAVQLHLSNSALRMFLSHPEWLETPNTQLQLTLSTLYLLDRFNHCMTTHQHSEESLLSYLGLANSTADTTTTNSFLAKLLGWTPTEVSVVTATLASRKAQTMKDVDWVMRCHATCKATGLSATSLLSATALNNDSTSDAWKKVGEAVMAASH